MVAIALLICSSSVCQTNDTNIFYRFMDSADVYVSDDPQRAQRFLDSIPEPITTNLKGRLSFYYQLKGLLNDSYGEQAKRYQNFFLALKYAKLEKDYDIAGMVALEMFYNTYIIEKDSSAYSYLEEAKNFYSLSQNTNGLVEVQQMDAYVEFYNNNYTKSNALILDELETYKSIKEDQYYYMYALFMLASNYTHVYDLDNAHKYLNLLELLKNDATISLSLNALHRVTIYNCLAEEHLKNKEIDSSLTYLLKATSLHKYMNNSDLVNYYTFYSNYYDAIGDAANKRVYIDSLQLLHKLELKETVDASFEINRALVSSEKQLQSETKKKNLNWYFTLGLSGVIVILIVFVMVRYKVIKQKINEFTQRHKEYSYMQTNHEKLKVKVRGLEDYISDVKIEIKTIAGINDMDEQRTQIKNLYKNIHHNSSTLLNKGENHLELISELNVEFFNQINSKHPELNHSEVIICYYIFTGFKNKEIAAFLGTSERAIESKRYRISKKLSLQEKEIVLLDYLQQI